MNRKTLAIRARLRTAPREARRGIFLIIAMVVIIVATLAATNFTELMLAYDEASYLIGRRTQAQQLAMSGIDHARLVLTQPRQIIQDSGGVYNNPTLFQAINVVESLESDQRGNFTVIAASHDQSGMISGYRYGLQNESARLHINALIPLEKNLSIGAMVGEALLGDESSDEISTDSAAASLLMVLPNMTEEVADCILDWLDEDDDPRPLGAEIEYYGALSSPYEPRNGPIDSVEELLLVKGVYPELLFGLDSNRNGMIDASERSGAVGQSFSGASMLGWAHYLTVYSKESNLADDGEPRININGEDLELLYADLSTVLGNDDWASFIVAYRMGGQPASGGVTGASSDDTPQSENEVRPWTAAALEELDLSGGGEVNFNQVLDLIGATVTLGEGDDQVTFASPFANSPLAMPFYLEPLATYLTAQDYESIPGRININECPEELIYGLPGLSEEVAQELVDARGSMLDGTAYLYDYWPLAEGIVTLEEMKMLSAVTTAGGDVFRVQSVGYFEGSNESVRLEAIIDATDGRSRLLFFRDLSHLGRGFDVSVLGVRGVDAIGQLQQSSTQ